MGERDGYGTIIIIMQFKVNRSHVWRKVESWSQLASNKLSMPWPFWRNYRLISNLPSKKNISSSESVTTAVTADSYPFTRNTALCGSDSSLSLSDTLPDEKKPIPQHNGEGVWLVPLFKPVNASLFRFLNGFLGEVQKFPVEITLHYFTMDGKGWNVCNKHEYNIII